jgi:hypothetical protein
VFSLETGEYVTENVTLDSVRQVVVVNSPISVNDLRMIF